MLRACVHMLKRGGAALIFLPAGSTPLGGVAERFNAPVLKLYLSFPAESL